MNPTQKTILVVEDEEEIREDLALFLEFSGYLVFQASNGKEAYQIYQDNVLDLIITDIEMPRMNGLELTEKIRTQDTTISILMISGYSDKDKLLRAVKLNLIDYIIKPFTQKGILKTVSEIFEKQDKKAKEDEITHLQISNYLFDFKHNLITHDGTDYTLTTAQSEVLKLMLENKNRVLSPVDIYYHLYPNHDKEYSNASIRNIIKRLRHILPANCIESVYSQGYKINMKNLK